MFSNLTSSRWLLPISGILCIIMGIMMLSTPLSGIVAIAVWIGMMILVSGIIEVIAYFNQPSIVRSGWLLAGGLLSIFIGLWLLTGRGTDALALAIPFVISIWILISGVMRAVGAFSLRDCGITNWGWVLVGGIMEAVLGGLMMYHPMLPASFLSVLLSMLFFSHGFSDIALFFNAMKAE